MLLHPGKQQPAGRASHEWVERCVTHSHEGLFPGIALTRERPVALCLFNVFFNEEGLAFAFQMTNEVLGR